MIVRRAGTLCMALLIVVLVACGADATQTPRPTPSPTATTAPSASGPSATATVAPSPTTRPTSVPTPSPTNTSIPVAKQELRVNLGGEPSSLDPQRAPLASDFSVIRQLGQGLFGFKPDLSLEPVVAAKIPTTENEGISPDSLTYTFELRPDVTWSDGRALTAEDFVYSIKRVLDPQVGSRFAPHYFAIKGGLEFVGSMEADEATRASLREAIAVEALDEHTLRITLVAPNPTLLQKLALPSAFPVRQDIVEQFGDQWTEAGNHVGNGPYVLAEWDHLDHITLTSNANYWGPAPKLDSITFEMIADPNSELAAYLDDGLDLARVPPGTEQATLADPSLADQVVRFPKLTSVGFIFNTAQAPFDDVLVRRAFTTAIDRSAWVETVKNGVGIAATSWLPPGMSGHDPELGGEYQFDPVGASELLADAGFPGGEDFPEVSYPFVALQDQPLIAQFLKGQLKEHLGIGLVLEPLDPPSWFQKVVGARDFHMTGTGWSADYPDPENFLAPLFITGSPQNIGQYSSQEFDRLAGLASVELDEEARLDFWTSAHEILVADVPVAFFFFEESFFLKKPKLRGLTLTGMDGAIPGDSRLAEAFIAP